MKKICKNCKKDFEIEKKDLDFYARVDSPTPNYCPECRAQRRLAFRNERTLYKRNCDLCQKGIISLYPTNTSFPVYCHDCWWGDSWDAKNFGMDYNPSKTFFGQFTQLQ